MSILLGLELLLVASYGMSINNIFQNFAELLQLQDLEH